MSTRTARGRRTFTRLACTVLLIACVQARANEVVDLLNRLRAPGGACAAQGAPLAANPMLDTAAANLARGSGLENALASAGYRMTQVQMLSFDVGRAPARLEAIIASTYCAQLAAPNLLDAGVYRAGNRVWIVLAAPFAPKVGLTREQIEASTLELVNQARSRTQRCGDTLFRPARPLEWNEVLESVARAHAADMSGHNYFSHAGRDGSMAENRVKRAGYKFRAVAENIAAGQLSTAEVVAGWIKSPEHCANLMHPGFTEMGVAVSVNASSAIGAYWVQLFGTR